MHIMFDLEGIPTTTNVNGKSKNKAPLENYGVKLLSIGFSALVLLGTFVWRNMKLKKH